MKKLLAITTALLLISCTENVRARKFGGSEEIHLKPNEVLITATWKESNLWIVTKDTTTGVCYMRESSSFGVWEGQITFK